MNQNLKPPMQALPRPLDRPSADPIRLARGPRRPSTLHPAWIVLAALALNGCSSGGSEGAEFQPATGIRLETVVEGLDRPVHLTAPASDPRLFVVEQRGRIRVVADGRLLPEPFLDITDRVRVGAERGLLSVAFHPDYASNGRLFVNYTDRNGDTRIERYTVTADPDVADPHSAHLVLEIDQPYSNHNGGLVAFGPDGMLYVGMGDGGSAGDPQGNGQDTGTLLGKLLRIDVDHGDPYAIPADNPLAARRDSRPEIWAWGLRNPWRFAFDSTTGLLYIADVGQSAREEIDVAPARKRGLNYGWRIMEGSQCFREPDCKRRGLTLPAVEYGREDGCSVTGGLVYRGRRIPKVAGHYFFSDYCTGWIRSFRFDRGRIRDRREWQVGARYPVSSFGEDAEGELYVVSHDGRVLKIVPDD